MKKPLQVNQVIVAHHLHDGRVVSRRDIVKEIKPSGIHMWSGHQYDTKTWRSVTELARHIEYALPIGLNRADCEKVYQPSFLTSVVEHAIALGIYEDKA